MSSIATEPTTTDEIAGMAESGEPTSAHFASEGALKQPIERINVDLKQRC